MANLAIDETVKSGKRQAAPYGGAIRFLQEVAIPYIGTNCLKWPYTTIHGYGVIRGKNASRIVSRVVCEIKHGPPPTPKHDAAHSCGNGPQGCVNPNHLSWKTRKANKADMIGHGTNGKKLSNEDIHAIRALKGIVMGKDIAAMFGVSRSNVSMILSGKTWHGL